MKICMHVTNNDVSMVLRACILLFHLFGHHKLSESYNFSFFHFSGYVLSQNLILEEVLKWFFFHCGWSWSFLMMFSQTSNWQTLKFFNLKGKRWEKKLYEWLKLVKISSFGKKVNKAADKLMKMACMWQIMTFLWFWGLVYCYFT